MREIVLSLPRLHDAQQKILRESKRFNVCCLGRRTGKTVLGLSVMIDGPRGLGALDGNPVAWFSPTFSALKQVWRDALNILRPVIRSKNVQDRRIELITGGVIEFWSLDNPDSGRGRRYSCVVVDEAAMVRKLDEAFEGTIRPLLSDYCGEAWILSTPKGDNYFKTLFDRAGKEEEWASFQMPTWVNPYISKDEIEAMRRSMPRLFFLQEVEAQFVTFAGTYIKREYLRKGQPPSGLDLYMGVDLAISMRDSADYTAIVLLGIAEDGKVWIVDADRRRVGFRDAIEWIKEKAARWRPVEIAVEAVQYQAAAVEELLRTTDLPVRKVKPKPGEDKLTRAIGLIARYEQGLVWHSESLPDFFEREVLSFGPDAEHDDMVDAMVYAFMLAGEFGRSRIIVDEIPANNVDGRGTCGQCVEFNGGFCVLRGFRVGGSDIGCDLFSVAHVA